MANGVAVIPADSSWGLTLLDSVAQADAQADAQAADAVTPSNTKWPFSPSSKARRRAHLQRRLLLQRQTELQPQQQQQQQLQLQDHTQEEEATGADSSSPLSSPLCIVTVGHDSTTSWGIDLPTPTRTPAPSPSTPSRAKKGASVLKQVRKGAGGLYFGVTGKRFRNKQ
jgi:hypothetical protein